MQSKKIGCQIIDGDVIPNRVLFTEPTLSNTPFATLANTDIVMATISFLTDLDNDKKK